MTFFDGLAAGVIVTALSVSVLPASAAGLAAAPPGTGSPPATAPSASRPPPPAPSAPAAGSSQSSTPQVSQDAAARSRMHECGHQWSSMKKAGTVGVLTWKEFSAGCLALNK